MIHLEVSATEDYIVNLMSWVLGVLPVITGQSPTSDHEVVD
jgi:hypothetical protein